MQAENEKLRKQLEENKDSLQRLQEENERLEKRIRGSRSFGVKKQKKTR